MWIQYNENPAGRNVGDCAVRAVSVALGIDWETAYDMIADAGYKMGDSDFLTAIEVKYAEDIWPIMDELMESMAVLQPRIYDQVMRKVRNS